MIYKEGLPKHCIFVCVWCVLLAKVPPCKASLATDLATFASTVFPCRVFSAISGHVQWKNAMLHQQRPVMLRSTLPWIWRQICNAKIPAWSSEQKEEGKRCIEDSVALPQHHVNLKVWKKSTSQSKPFTPRKWYSPKKSCRRRRSFQVYKYLVMNDLKI